MSRKWFRGLLILYFIVLISGATDNIQEGSIPSDILERAQNAKYLFMEETPMALQITIASFMAITIMLALIGSVGMFFFWEKARYLFALYVALKILLNLAYKWSVGSSIYSLSASIESLLDGMIISLVFLRMDYKKAEIIKDVRDAL